MNSAKQNKWILIMAMVLNIQVLTFDTACSQTSQYRIANKFHLEGSEGWDYITADDTVARLYVAHGSMVQILDASKGKLLGTIPDLRGVHGVALAQDAGKGFISCGRDSSVVVFNLINFDVLAKIKVTGSNPDAIVYDQVSHKVFTFNGRSSSATVIDGTTNRVIATIGLEGKPEFAVLDGEGKLYVNIEDKNLISIIDIATMKVESSYLIAPGESPSGLAIDTKTHRLFSVCDNKLMVISDYKTQKVIKTLPIGDHCDGVAFDPQLKRAYSANGDGTITVVQEVDANKFKVIETIDTQVGARTICIFLKSHHLYLPTAELNPPIEQAPNRPSPPPRPSVKPGTFVILDVEYNRQKEK